MGRVQHEEYSDLNMYVTKHEAPRQCCISVTLRLAYCCAVTYELFSEPGLTALQT